MTRSWLRIVVGVVVGSFIAGCGDGNEIAGDARRLANQFYEAFNPEFDPDRLVDLVDYPFLLDEVTVKTEREFIAEVVKRKKTFQNSVRPVNLIEVLSYEEFLEGKPIAGKSLDRAAAEKQAESIRLREGGALVRLFSQDSGRSFYLVMHRDRAGVLKVTSFRN